MPLILVYSYELRQRFFLIKRLINKKTKQNKKTIRRPQKGELDMFNHEHDDRLKDDVKSCYQLIKTITKLVYHNPVPDITVEPAWVYSALSKQNVVLRNLKPVLYTY